MAKRFCFAPVLALILFLPPPALSLPAHPTAPSWSRAAPVGLHQDTFVGAGRARGAGQAGQTSQSGETRTDESQDASEEGIPIQDTLVRQTCGSCHQADEEGRMSRISYRRTTPEGWQATIRRMAALNDAPIEPDAAREVVKYLSNHLGLAPEELRPAAFEVERRMIDYSYADRDTEDTCRKCHSMGRIITQRRTKEEWELLIAMHRGFYPLVDSQAFRRNSPSADDGHPMDAAIAHLTDAFPLRTPAWAAWSANMRPARLEGTWVLSGRQAGKGPVYGRVVITASATSPDEFQTDVTYVYPRAGTSVTRSGRAVVYTGFQWRGRTFEGPDETTALREVMFVERNWRQMWGRWFTGAYDETGLDITLERAGSDPIVVGVYPPAVRTSSYAQEVQVYGINLPSNPAPGDFDLGTGVRVRRVVRATPEVVTVELDVTSDAAVGARDLFLGAAGKEAALIVYDKVDSIRVEPQAGMSRVGGIVFPKQYEQFEAYAYHHGADGEPDTEDDLRLGLVEATWNLEEYSATFQDDDIEFVGTIDQEGFFSPADDGPNPARRNNANNIGDVWVVAEYMAEGQSEPLRARAHLLVTVPLYMQWNQTGQQ